MSNALRHHARIRFVLVFFAAFFCMALLAGRKLTQPSSADHFTQLALGWLDGRLHHEGFPTGYCRPNQRRAGKCKNHRYDDWARVWELELAPNSRTRIEETEEVLSFRLRGFPCRTNECKALRKKDKIETWWILGQGWQKIPRAKILRRSHTWYISFPPGPAIAMLPVVAIWGNKLWDVFITCVVAALIPTILWRFFEQHRGTSREKVREHVWATIAWTLASPASLLGSHGRVWFTAQCFSALFLCLYLSHGWNAGHPIRAGFWLAMAIACRPINAIFTVPFYALEWWREQRNWSNAWRFLLPLGLIGTALATHNWLRFSDPFEFGHRFLDIRWQDRMQRVGIFDWSYFPRNLQCLFVLWPQISPHPPFFRVSIHGLALSISSPWIFGVLRARKHFPQRLGLILAAIGSALPSLFYQNSGQLQFSYRFAVDWLPFFLCILVFSDLMRNRSMKIAILFAALIHSYGSFQFSRNPASLFVTEPLGWPFEEEFQ